ncbi:MAG TPA: hypothetical protein VK900_22490 [Anaerolineales bacterium]|nr:hypothetical protein [Anaerolineales bacterium]
MRRVLLLSVLFILIVTACAPAAATEGPSGVTESPEDNIPDMETLGAAEQAAIEQLSESLGLEATDIVFISSEQTEFSDACLEVMVEGISCAQVITSGRIITLEANGIEYIYHVSEDGSQVQPASIALIWRREGGIAGFCDTLIVFRSGEVTTSTCKSQGDGTEGTLATLLSAQERQQFDEWMGELGETTLDESDPAGVADRMVITLEIMGAGDDQPTQSQQQELFTFAQELYQALSR